MPDTFKQHKPSLTTPIDNWAAITPHDTNEIATIPRAVFCTVTGNAVLIGKDGTQATFNVVEGNWYPLRPRIMTTASTATLIALF